jgi:hypothetical protein
MTQGASLTAVGGSERGHVIRIARATHDQERASGVRTPQWLTALTRQRDAAVAGSSPTHPRGLRHLLRHRQPGRDRCRRDRPRPRHRRRDRRARTRRDRDRRRRHRSQAAATHDRLQALIRGLCRFGSSSVLLKRSSTRRSLVRGVCSDAGGDCGPRNNGSRLGDPTDAVDSGRVRGRVLPSSRPPAIERLLDEARVDVDELLATGRMSRAVNLISWTGVDFDPSYYRETP